MKRLAQLALVAGLALWALSFWDAGMLPPTGTDTLIYHLTIPAFWLQRGFLAPVELPFHDSAAEHAPLLTEIVAYLLMRTAGSIALVWIVQPLFLLLMLRWFYLSARLVGTDRTTGLLLSALLLFFPPFAKSLQLTLNNEIVLTSGCAWFLYGVLLQRVHPQRGVLHAWAGFVLMVATKYVGLIYAAAGLPLLLPATWRWLWGRVESRELRVGSRGLRVESRRGLSTRLPSQSVLRKAAVLVAIVLGGGFFYLRNLWLHGNPVYPATTRIAGITVFAGLYDPSPLVDHSWRPANLGRMLFHNKEEFALTLPWSGFLWLAVAVSAGDIFVPSRRRARWLVFAVTVLFPLLSVLLFFSKVPFWREHRLLFPVYYALWLSAAHALAWARRVRRPLPHRVLAWLLLAALLCQLFLVELQPRLTAFFQRFALWRTQPAAARRELYRALYEEPDYYGALGKAWNMLERRTAQTPATVAYAGTPVIFPLFGPHLKNRVLYVPTSTDDRPTPISLMRGDSVYLRLAQARRRLADPAFWLDRLQKASVEYVLLMDDPDLGGVAQELQMITARREQFDLLFQEGNVRLFRLKVRNVRQSTGKMLVPPDRARVQANANP